MSILDNLMRGWPIFSVLHKLTRSRNNNISYSVTFVQKNTPCENSNKTCVWAADNFASVDRLFISVIK